MAPEPIHIEAEDEVPAIIERIRRSAAEEVHLVLPPRARLGQSRFNFQLLRQYSTRLGKRVVVWSPDPAVQRLAEESGFPAFLAEPSVQPARAAAPSGRRPAAAGSGPWGPRPAPGPPAPGPPSAPAAGWRPGSTPPGGAGRSAAQRRLAGAARIRIGAPQRLPDRLTQYQPARYALYGGALLVLLAGIVLVLFYIPSARVTLVAQAQPFSTNVDITAEPGKPPVRVRKVNVAKTATMKDIQATGTNTTSGQLASGQFTYVNNCPTALQIPNGQRLRSVTGAIFAQIGDVTVGQNQQHTVDIKATQAGQAGNVQPGQITGIEGNQFPCLTGTNQGPTAGGTDDQKQTVVQSSDVQSAKALLEQQLRQQVIDELKGGLQRGETLAPQPTFSNEQFSTDHNAGDPVAKFTATLNLTAEGDYYMGDDVQTAFTARLTSKVPADKQLTTNKVVAAYTVTAALGGHLDFSGTANGYIAPRIDADRVKSQLAGKSAGQAHDVLSQLPVQRSVISESPPLPLLPLSSSRIYIDYGVEAVSPPRSS
ncbi:MAG TPA: baseplate J/gp47 family protein [Candidatus Eisenbacteria bacterium]|nr:baseplate J/gp47 family protein [Candidatus Eisenbacteria bacterium]